MLKSIVPLLLVGACSSDPSAGDGITPRGDGGAPSFDPTRVQRGEATVLGRSASGTAVPRTFDGPPTPGAAGTDVVRCSFAPHGDRSPSGVRRPANVSISASIAGRSQPQVQATLYQVLEAAPLAEELVYDDVFDDNPLTFVARLSHDSATSFEEYEYGYDSAVTPTSRSTCLIDLSSFTQARLVGQIACRSLFATSESRNASNFGTPAPTASVTLAFDCPVQLLDANGDPVGGGGSGSGGSSGSGSSGAGGVGGSGAGPSAGSGGTGGSTPPNPADALGTPCEVSSDCAETLTCHYSSDYIAHQQCASTCDSSEQCKAKFGSDSFCIGANVCVRACSTSLECPAKSHCNLNGWCERSGPGSGVPYCAGSATPCSLLSGSQCITAGGCQDDSRCKGVSYSCYSQFDSYSCSSQQGCYWSTLSKSCSGSAWSCSSMNGSLSCASQEGCHWDAGCTGVARTCSSQYTALCTGQPGCYVQTD